jgi:uncharacterized protein
VKSFLLPRTIAGSLTGALVGVFIVGICLFYAGRVGLSWDELGFGAWRRVPASVASGLLLIAAGALILALAARVVAMIGAPLDLILDNDLRTLDADLLRRRVLLFLPFDTMLPEEIVFRGVLWAEVGRQFRSRWWQVGLSMLAFGAWHSGLASMEHGYDVGGFLFAFLVYFVGGVVFAVPVLVTGNIVGSMATHWLTDTLLFILGNDNGAWLRDPILGHGSMK